MAELETSGIYYYIQIHDFTCQFDLLKLILMASQVMWVRRNAKKYYTKTAPASKPDDKVVKRPSKPTPKAAVKKVPKRRTAKK